MVLSPHQFGDPNPAGRERGHGLGNARYEHIHPPMESQDVWGDLAKFPGLCGAKPFLARDAPSTTQPAHSKEGRSLEPRY